MVTDALAAARDGAPGALDRVFPLVYGQLRDLARRRLAGERSGHTLSTTALVHEAYVKLIDQTRVQWQDRAHFLAVAAGAMRRILVDHARRRRAVRRGGAAGVRRISLDDVEIAAGERAAEIVALDEALQRLARIDARQARVVELRFFGGLSEKETGDALSPEMALRLSRLFGNSAEFWLNAQCAVDLWDAAQAIKEDVARIKPLRVA
jgi:RNA polymerase sigma-70 factor, ECF subfamily